MTRFLVARILQAALALLFMTAAVFLMVRVTGSPEEFLTPPEATQEQINAIRAQWGLDRPIIVQYGKFMGNALRGEFGTSLTRGRHKAMEEVLRRFPATLQLSGLALGLTIVLGVLLGVVAAVRKDSIWDQIIRLFSFTGMAVPVFWLAIVLMWIFAVNLEWLPVARKTSLASFVLPATAMAWHTLAGLVRLVRSGMLDVLDTEFVKFARAKGVPEALVIWKHSLRNGIIPGLTFLGYAVPLLLTHSVIVETIFAWPGAGKLALDAVMARDYPVVQAIVLLFTSIFIVFSLFIDVIYLVVDPRVRH